MREDDEALRPAAPHLHHKPADAEQSGSVRDECVEVINEAREPGVAGVLWLLTGIPASRPRLVD